MMKGIHKKRSLVILGKKRQLKGAPGNWYLADMKDVDDIGIFGALPVPLWKDENYLNSIRVPKGTSERRKEQER